MNNIVFDIDGTICFDGVSISPRIIEAIDKLDDNFNIFFASARHPRDIAQILPMEILDKSILIGANGAICKSNDKVVYKKCISQSHIDNIIHVLEENEASYLIDGVYGYLKSDIEHDFFQRIKPRGSCRESSIEELMDRGVLKFLILSSNDNNHDGLKADLDNFIDIELHNHSDGTFDITVPNVNKYVVLDKLYNIGNTFVCFGNDLNDLPLFQNAKYSYLIGEHEQLIPYASEQILESSEDAYIKSIVDAISGIDKKFKLL